MNEETAHKNVPPPSIGEILTEILLAEPPIVEQADVPPPTAAEEATVAEILAEEITIEDRIEAKYQTFIGRGLEPGAAVRQLSAYFKGTKSAEFRKILRARGYQIPEPPSAAERGKMRQTPKANPQENAHLVRPPRRAAVNIERPADRVPPPPQKPTTEPERPLTPVMGADHIETIQAIRMILQGREPAEISREFRGAAHTDRITTTAISVFCESNKPWLDWLKIQPPFKVSEVLVELQQSLKPIESRGGARPTTHQEDAHV